MMCEDCLQEREDAQPRQEWRDDPVLCVPCYDERRKAWRLCRMCDGRGQDGSAIFVVRVTTPDGEEESAFCVACWDREAREIPVSAWEDSIADTARGAMPDANADRHAPSDDRDPATEPPVLTATAGERLTLLDIRARLAAAGVVAVETMAGPIPVADWTPYGNGIEQTWRGRIERQADGRLVVVDAPEPVQYPGSDAFVLGRWPTVRGTAPTRLAAVIDETPRGFCDVHGEDEPCHECHVEALNRARRDAGE